MEPNAEANLTAKALSELRALQDNLQGELVITEPFTVQDEGQTLRADAVVLFMDRIVAVVAVTDQAQPDPERALQLQQLAELLGAPLPLIRSARGWSEVLDAESGRLYDVLNGESNPLKTGIVAFMVLPGLSPRAFLLASIDLRRRVTDLLRQLAQALGLAARPAVCQVVDQAVQEWRAGKGADPAAVNAAPLAYLHSEFAAMCGNRAVPLSQCVLIGALFEGVLQDFTTVKGIPVRGTFPTLGTYLGAVDRRGHLRGAPRHMLPRIIVDHRNRVHPDNFRSNPGVSLGLVVNSADVLLWAVRELNAVP